MSLLLPVAGDSNLYVTFFQGIVEVFGASAYSSLLNVTILLGGFSVLAAFVLKRDLLTIIKWFFSFYIIFYMCFVPKTDLNIVDYAHGKKTNTVQNVPLGLGILASMTAQISYGLTELIDAKMGMPEELSYTQAGMIYPIQLLQTATQLHMTNALFENNLQSFLKQCVFYNLHVGKNSLDELIKQADLASYLSGNMKHSSFRGFYKINGNEKQFRACNAALGELLSSELNQATNQAMTQYGEIINVDDAIKLLSDSYQFLNSNNSLPAETMIKQIILANAIQQYISGGTEHKQTQVTLGAKASALVPLVKAIFEIMLYGAFIFILLLALFSFGMTLFKNYLFLLLWVQLWPPFFAIFNSLISHYGRDKITTVLSSGLSLQAIPALQQTTTDLIGLAGFLAVGVPFIAGIILIGARQTVGQLSHMLGNYHVPSVIDKLSENSQAIQPTLNTQLGSNNSIQTATDTVVTHAPAVANPLPSPVTLNVTSAEILSHTAVAPAAQSLAPEKPAANKKMPGENPADHEDIFGKSANYAKPLAD